MQFLSSLVAILSAALLVSSAPANIESRATKPGKLSTPVCGTGKALVSHDCNVALLGLCGGIAGSVQFCRVASSTSSATSGTCRVTITTTDGGNLDISKGRLENNPGFEDLEKACGAKAGNNILIAGGSTKAGGNTFLQISAA